MNLLSRKSTVILATSAAEVANMAVLFWDSSFMRADDSDGGLVGKKVNHPGVGVLGT